MLGLAEASFAAEKLAVVAETVSAAAIAAAAIAAAVHSCWVIENACAAVSVGYNAAVHSAAVIMHVLVAAVVVAAVVAAADVALRELLVVGGRAFEDYGTEQWVTLGYALSADEDWWNFSAPASAFQRVRDCGG